MLLGNWCEEDSDSGDGDDCSNSPSLIQIAESAEDDTFLFLCMMFGPLIRTWCMRFEAKQAYFKDVARRLKNFKNLPYSLAKWHQ